MLHGKLCSEFSIVQLIYCSHATKAGDKADFERDLLDIFDHSHAYNPMHDITGALLTDGRMFAHVVEGPSAAVNDLYAKLLRDERHNRIVALQHILIHVRLFGVWPLAFLRVGAMPHVGMLNARSTSADLRDASVLILKACRPILLR